MSESYLSIPRVSPFNLLLHLSPLPSPFPLHPLLSPFAARLSSGQIELYSHVPVLRTIVDQLRKWDFQMCVVYVLDSQVRR